MKKTILTLSFLLCLFSAQAQKSPRLSESTIDDVIAAMTLHEKAQLIVGSSASTVPGAAGFTTKLEKYGIPSIALADGPMGLRISPTRDGENGTFFCTAFPSNSLMAATWDTDLVKRVGNAMGNEAKSYGVDVLLTPGINIMRNPLCGRNFEYFSEDPALSGNIGAAMVNGIQSEGVGACVKHFIANNQQTNKLGNDARISQRTLRELYLRNFEICVKASHPWTMMSSYNKLCGIFTQTNYDLLTTVLRNEWGFNGTVMTDWYKHRNTAEQVYGGTNLLMPGETLQTEDIEKAVNDGILTEKSVDASVRSILQLIIKSNSFKQQTNSSHPDLAAHSTLSRQMATEGMVLLKNDSNVLPLDKKLKVSLFGATAYMSMAGGSGSSNVNKPHIIDISRGIEDAGFSLDNNLKQIYSKYTDYQTTLQLQKHPDAKDWEKISYYRAILPEMDLRDSKKLIEAQAEANDVAIIVVGRKSGEEYDRTIDGDFNLSEIESKMINDVCQAFHAKGKKAIVIMNTGGVMETASWKDLPDAILLAWFPGQECGYAVTDILTGKVNPSGKLPMTWPLQYSDIPSSKNFPHFGVTKQGKDFDFTNYEEGIWVGYRYFNTVDMDVAYPFGFGLSYTNFSYSDAKVSRKEDSFTASVKITNTGKCEGKEVVELFVTAPQGKLKKPAEELRSFAKTKILKPRESETVIMHFNTHDLASFDENASTWIAEKGDYKALFAASATDIRKTVKFNIGKESSWKVDNVLAPVEKVKEMELGNGYRKSDIKDLALIYQGGTHRIDWTTDQFLPYVTHRFADGHKDWLFDGFLFLEYTNGKDVCYAGDYERINGHKTDWQWLLNRIFEKNKSLDALDACITSQIKEIGKPNFKHKIVLGLPMPRLDNGNDWGELNGKKLDFTKTEDQLAAAKWYIDELTQRFKAAHYKNIELDGFYWMEEDEISGKRIIKDVSNYIHSQGKTFCWIPYWKARGTEKWKDYGFDIAYQQPNHFFRDTIPDSRLDDACRLGYKLNMGMEMEFDLKALADSKEGFRSRMITYLDKFEKYGVLRNSAIAYYSGSRGILGMYNSKNPLDQEIMDRMANIIIDRRIKK
jgi:beta-glucosidase